jgi:hypothetical protein
VIGPKTQLATGDAANMLYAVTHLTARRSRRHFRALIIHIVDEAFSNR